MKKIIAILLVLCMVIGFAACGEKKEETPVVPETIENPGIQLTENIPIISLFGTYEANEKDTPKGWDLMYSLKGKANADYIEFVVLSKEDKGTTLEELAKKEAESRYEEQELEVATGDSLFSSGNVPFAYFVSFDEPSYVKHYFVADAGQVFEIQFYIETEAKKVADGKLVGYFPLDFKQAEFFELKEDGPKERYTSVQGDFANLDVYLDDADGITMAELVEELKLEYKPDYIEEYSAELANGNKQHCVYFTFNSNKDGRAYVNYSIMTIADDDLLCLNFWTFEEDANPITLASIPAFMWGFDTAK